MTTCFRWVFVVLAVYILLKSILSLLSTRATPEVWGYLYVEDGVSQPITHWENVIGRSSSADLNLEIKTVSKNHAILNRRSGGRWMIKDLGSKNGTIVNGTRLLPSKRYIISPGDEINMSGVKCRVASMSLEESRNNSQMRSMDKSPVAPWRIMLAVTLFQLLTIIQLVIGMGSDCNPRDLLSIVLLSVVMWAYVLVFRSKGRKGFEMELIAFFMSTINLAVAATSAPGSAIKELIALCMGLGLMIFMCIYLRDLDRTKKVRPVVAGLSVGLLLFNLIFGTVKYGAANWV